MTSSDDNAAMAAQWGLDVSRRATIERPGCPVSYWLIGRMGAPLVVLSHATLTDHTYYSETVSALAPHFGLLSWDIRGHGASRPLHGALSVPDAVDDLIAILDALRVERAALIGHSLGSYVAQELTVRHAERVTALAVMGGRCITTEPCVAGRDAPSGGSIMKVSPFESLKRQAVVASAEEPSSREYLSDKLSELTKHEYLKILDGVGRCSHLAIGRAKPVPTLLIVGELDRTGDVRASMAAWAEREPDAEYHVIPGAGHCANLDRPNETSALILDFLLRVASPHGTRHPYEKEVHS